MNKPWIIGIFLISFTLLASLKAQEADSLSVYFKDERVLKIHRFEAIKAGLSPVDQEYFELWESILTGRTAPLSRWIKDRYRLLALNHLFTPSGFHLTAVLMPFMKFIKSSSRQLFFLSIVGAGLFFLPGMSALKRMILIKGNQKAFGMKTGFFIALLLDVMWGTFQTSALSFTYSFLFLGIIYSRKKGLELILFLFMGQLLIAFFQQTEVSPLLIILSPLLNFCFGLIMPFLFILALPMWGWQVSTAIFLLKVLQVLVDLSAKLTTFIPTLEITFPFLLMLVCLVIHRRQSFYVLLILISGSLNICQLKSPSMGSYEFRPQGEVKRIVSKEAEDWIYFEDGSCKRRLVNGFWWERCSPSRRSTRKIKTKRLSFPS